MPPEGGPGGTTIGPDGAVTVDAGADAERPADCAPGVPPIKLTRVVEGVDSALFVTAPKGDTSRLFVVLQDGTIRISKDGVLLPKPFLDLTSLVTKGGEQGLLGVAFHPDYATNGRFFVSYTTTGGGAAGRSVIAEYKVSSDADVAGPDPVKTLFAVDQPYENHNGGMIAFGPDGKLYVGFGDGGSGGDPENRAQNLTTKLGKIVRIDVDTYPTPAPGNMTGAGVDPDIWDFGLRNPWRFSFDRSTGDLYIGDVGQSTREEIDVEPKGAGGKNYGWNCTEGNLPYEATAPGCATATITAPVKDHPRSEAESITGGYVYRGDKIRCLRGRYIYGDFATQRIFSFEWKGGPIQNESELTGLLNPASSLNLMISSFGEDAVGELYVVSRAGAVYRIDPR